MTETTGEATKDEHVAVLESAREGLKARAEAFAAALEDMRAQTPGAHAVGAAPPPKRGSDAVAHLHFAQAAKRSLALALDLLDRAHGELVGHVNFAATATGQFAAFQKTQTATATAVAAQEKTKS